jgi:hypothetical protein
MHFHCHLPPPQRQRALPTRPLVAAKMHSVHSCGARSAALGPHSRALLCLSSLRPHRMRAAAAATTEFLVPYFLGINGIRTHVLTLFHRPCATACGRARSIFERLHARSIHEPGRRPAVRPRAIGSSCRFSGPARTTCTIVFICSYPAGSRARP